MAKETEYSLQLAICNYLKVQYPDVMFRSDLGGIRLTPGLAAKAKSLQHGRGFPDLFIPEPRLDPTGWPLYGLFVEIKVEGTKIHKKDGINFTTPHIREQAEMLVNLTSKGYFARFGIGFDKCKELIDWYLSLKVLR